MDNKQIIEYIVSQYGYELGCYSKRFDTLKLTKKHIEQLVYAIKEESTELQLTINKVKYIIEVDTVGNEKDVRIKTLSEYEGQYGEIENR